MKKTFLKIVISAGVVASTIGTLAPLGVSAQGKIGNINTEQVCDNASNNCNEDMTTNKSNTNSNDGTKTEKISCNNVTSSCKNNYRVKQRRWVKIDGTWYYFDINGNMKTGWIKDHGKWYYTDSTGAMQTGVIKISGKVYYFNKSGVMQTGLVRIGNKIYRFARNGQAIGNKIPNFEKEFDSSNNLVTPNNGSNNESTSGNNSSSNDSNGNVGNVVEKPDNTNKPSDNTEGTGNNTQKPSDSVDSNNTINKPNNPQENQNNNSTVNKPNNSQENQNNNGTVNKPGNSQGTQGSTGSSNSSSNINVNGLPNIPEKYSVTVQNSAENKILELMNQKRQEAGLKPLTMDNTLLNVARYKSNHMIQNDYFSHTNPDGTKWTNWLQAIGYKYNATAENIAYNSYDPVELFNQWWNSAGHRENMMNPSYTKVGIGVLYGNGKYMGTQTFSN